MISTAGRWASALVAAVFATATLLAACSGPTTSTGSDPAGEASKTAYAQCMRENGVPDFPDPDSEGSFPIDRDKVDIDSDVFKKADETCEPLKPKESEAEQQKDYSAMLEFAKCMREQGISGYPDPPAPGSGPATQGDTRADGGPELGSEQFKAAQEACGELLPEGEEGPAQP